MNIKITSDLVAEPVSLTDAKKWLKVSFTDDDAMITSLIKSARIYLEKYTGLSFGTKTIEAIVDIDKSIDLPYGPAMSITSVEVKSGYDNWETLTVAAEDYELIGNILYVYSYSSPYRVTYTTGFGQLPEDLVSDIKALVSFMYQNRGINLSNEASSIAGFPRLNAQMYRKVVI